MEGRHWIQPLDTELLRAVRIAFPHTAAFTEIKRKRRLFGIGHPIQLPLRCRKVLRHYLSSPVLRVTGNEEVPTPSVRDVHVVDLATTVHSCRAPGVQLPGGSGA